MFELIMSLSVPVGVLGVDSNAWRYSVTAFAGGRGSCELIGQKSFFLSFGWDTL